MKALLVYPTHDNGREVCDQALDMGLDAACYPGRLTESTETTPANCWNAQADQAEAWGFPVVKTICPICPNRKMCQAGGYLHQMIEAQKAEVVICTHKRAEHSGIDELAQGRSYISIHEDPVDLLRPKLTITEADLVQAQFVMDKITNDPYYLDWFGTALRVDDQGNEYEDEELAVRKDRLHAFCLFLDAIIREQIDQINEAKTTCEWRPSNVMPRPTGIERVLFYATQRERAKFTDAAWRFILAASTGDLSHAAILVDRRHSQGTQERIDVRKTIVGFRDNRPPPTATVWFNDATVRYERLQTLVGHHVIDSTPQGHVPLQKKAVQLLRDVTHGTSQKTVTNLIRGVLADRPQFQRVGLITHRKHLKVLETLEATYADRIVKTTYFGSGDERSSNDWHERCDLILVVGTPRVPPIAIAEYLVQIGDIEAACRDGDWGMLCWRGKTESGEPTKVESRGYRDEAWREAHRDIVRAQIIQAVGRGRGILETGCEVLVLSNEECGLVISDVPAEPLNETSHKVLEYLHGATIQNPNIYYLGKGIVSTDIAQHTGLAKSSVRKHLQALERRGLVRKVGERRGWLPVMHSTSVTQGEVADA